MTWRIRITRVAMGMIAGMADARMRAAVVAVIDGLTTDPEDQGKPLIGKLAGYRSIRAAGQRYRIIYRVERDRVIVHVVAVGIRKDGDRDDIYRLAHKLLKAFKRKGRPQG